MQSRNCEVCIVGAGPAGLTGGLFTARAGLETLVLRAGDPILHRNAHLENVPGFPAGVNPRRFLDLLTEQAERNDVCIAAARATGVQNTAATADGRFAVETAAEATVRADAVVCASWPSGDLLADIDGVDCETRGTKTVADVTAAGETGVDGLYAAGRVAGEPHQTVVAAGHGAKVGLAVVHDADIPFYHDWVAPTGYFTGRDRPVPPGCEEIDEVERERRERESMAVMQEAFAEVHPDDPTMHPSVEE